MRDACFHVIIVLKFAAGADAELKAAIAVYPEFTLALNELGVQYLRLGQVNYAAEVLRSAVRLAPDDIPPRLNYAIALLNLKRFNEADRELRQVLQKNDALPTAHLYLGIVLIGEKNFEAAEQEPRHELVVTRREMDANLSRGTPIDPGGPSGSRASPP